VAPDVLAKVKSLIGADERVLVILDSNHTRDHVRQELEAYAPMVTPASYIVATDGIMFDLHDVPRGRPEWLDDNPRSAAADYAARHPQFELVQPAWPFNESSLRNNITHWPGAWLRRIG
jgi:cephalosporin hydroxylase